MGVNKGRELWNCQTLRGELLSYRCPESWSALPDSGNPTVRDCAACGKQVHLCQTPEEFVRAGDQGHCVAVPPSVRTLHLCAYQVGQPSAESVAKFRAQLAKVVGWWSVVIDRLPEALGTALEPIRAQVELRRDET